MREILRNHDDFKNEKAMILQYLEKKGHKALFLPKFHPELNPIECVWAQAKLYIKAYCKYNMLCLRKNVHLDLDSVTLQNIQNFHCKGRDYVCLFRGSWSWQAT